jgi:pimeloyl-ACP methyl ester carboxylesterase
MKNVRIYGEAPFNVAVIHGGPGAGGEMASVARELASGRGVLEPIQTTTTLDGQVEELRNVLEEKGDLPITLIGFSWGAWLGFILTAKRPVLVKKLVLVGSGPFEEEYTVGMHETRMSRLSEEERREVGNLTEVLNSPAGGNGDAALARIGELIGKADAYDPVEPDWEDPEPIECRADIYQSVWKEGAELRRSGELLNLGKRIECPVVAVHGDYDPHPAEGVRKPLAALLNDFRFILLEKCGHKPWIEREAREEFYRTVEDLL